MTHSRWLQPAHGSASLDFFVRLNYKNNKKNSCLHLLTCYMFGVCGVFLSVKGPGDFLTFWRLCPQFVNFSHLHLRESIIIVLPDLAQQYQ